MLVQIFFFKNNGDAQSCCISRGIKVMSHMMKLQERVVEARLRIERSICEQQYGFMPIKKAYMNSTTGAIFERLCRL